MAARFLTACFLAGGLLAAGSAEAATATGSFTVTATVVGSCSVITTTLDFSTYTATNGSPDDTSSAVSPTCSNGLAYTISLGAGTGAGATVALRKMTSGANTLNYQIYRETGRTTLWGDGTAGTLTVSGTGTGAIQVYTVYGRIPTGQYANVGSYSDTVVVTVTY